MVIIDKSIKQLFRELTEPALTLSEEFIIKNKTDLGLFMSEVYDEGLCSLINTEEFYPLIREAALNAAERGNNFDPTKSVSVKLYSGFNGWLLQITDSGEGFDYESVASSGYFQNQGIGFNYYKNSIANICFSDEGRTINISLIN